MKTPSALLLVLLGLGTSAFGQEEAEPPLPIETFTTYRLVNGQTAETMYKGDLMLTLSHRFSGSITDGFDNFFGFDDYADIRFAFAYGITDRLTAEIGRTRTGKRYDGQLKYKFLQQAPQGMPVSATLLGSAALMSDDFPPGQEDVLKTRHRMSYLTQLFVARRFHERIGGQLTGTWVHQNLADWEGEENNTYLLGAGASARITRLFHLRLEYYQPLNNKTRADATLQPTIGIGFDLLTPRHAFQISVSNTALLLEQEFMTQTTQQFFNQNGLMLGFHITRIFL